MTVYISYLVFNGKCTETMGVHATLEESLSCVEAEYKFHSDIGPHSFDKKPNCVVEAWRVGNGVEGIWHYDADLKEWKQVFKDKSVATKE